MEEVTLQHLHVVDRTQPSLTSQLPARRDTLSISEISLRVIQSAVMSLASRMSKTSINVRLTDRHKCHLSNLRL